MLQVKIKRRGDDRKFLAQVLAIGTECDIALLTVEDEEFWQDVEPLQLGPLPRLQDAVAVIGYPIGTALRDPWIMFLVISTLSEKHPQHLLQLCTCLLSSKLRLQQPASGHLLVVQCFSACSRYLVIPEWIGVLNGLGLLNGRYRVAGLWNCPGDFAGRCQDT